MGVIECSEVRVSHNKGAAFDDLWLEYYYIGEKSIKYLAFEFLAYNRVNDIVILDKTSKTTNARYQLTGPIQPKRQGRIEWNELWLNPDVSTIVISKIYIHYMDSTEEVINGKDIVNIYDSGSVYYREVIIPRRKEEERRKRIEESRKKLSNDVESMSEESISEILLEFKEDEEALLKILEAVRVSGKNGYLIGDYIEKEYSSNEKLMKNAVQFWKKNIELHQRFGAMIKGRRMYVKKYAAKIRIYEPAYVTPKKETCLSGISFHY